MGAKCQFEEWVEKNDWLGGGVRTLYKFDTRSLYKLLSYKGCRARIHAWGLTRTVYKIILTNNRY
ncbi:MAG: hypothetical protein D8M52_10185 [Chlorobi bacterium]|nr:hypothetical protein [Chlorobiota bacterium]